MLAAFGYGLILAGLIQLILHEPMVRLKREVKPWWRDSDRQRDRRLHGLLRIAVFVGGVLYCELGLSLSNLVVADGIWRALFYAACGVVTVGLHRARSAPRPATG